MSNLLSSAANRRQLQDTVNQVTNCADLPGAVIQLQQRVSQRRTEYVQALALSTSALPNGATVKSDLTSALRISLSADRDYLTWARQQEEFGCSPPAESSAYNAAVAASGQVNPLKAAFVQLWNPIAGQYQLPHITPDDI